MASGLQKFNPLGGLDKDSDPNYVRDGNYTDALNVRSITDNTESTNSIVPIKGTTSAFDIPSTLVAKNKKYRVYHDDDAGRPRTIYLYGTNGETIATIGYVDGATLADTVANFAAAAAAALAAGAPAQTATLTTGPANAYTTFELTTVTGYEYELVSHVVNQVTIVCIQEAWDASLLGYAHVIGSYDLLGDLFVLSTPNTNITTSTTKFATAAAAAGKIRVTTSVNHGLQSGYSYNIDLNIGTVPTRGSWIITVITPTQFDLENSVFSGVSSATTITITSYATAIGEIGVATFDVNTGAWTYTTLLKTKEWYFSTKKQADMAGELNSSKKSIYWTNDYESPRAFYYKGSYVSDGAIQELNSDGYYSYGTISEETALFLFNTNTTLSITGQAQAGGGVLSGNWRYAYRFLTESLVSTDVSELTNPISVFVQTTDRDTAAYVYGSISGTVTPKSNQLYLSNIIPGLFKYVELIGINYADTAIVGYTISRTQLPENATSLILNHTGLETGVTDFDLGLLSVQSAKYATAKNIRIIDSRMVMSNLTSRAIEDLSAWAQTITHELFSASMTGTRETTQTNYQFGEYLLPLNVYNYVGYTDNEVYRFGVRGRYKDSGELSPVFWVDDIIFNTAANNNIDTYVPSVNRRIAGLSSYDLTPSGSASLVYVRYVKFGFSLDYIVDGKAIRDIFSEIIFERTECVPEILACGCGSMTINGAMAGGFNYGNAPFYYNGEYPYISGVINSIPTVNALYSAVSGVIGNRNIAKLYYPDMYCEGNNISLVSGDKILNYGTPQSQSPNPANIWRSTSTPPTYYSSTIEYNGYIAGASPTTLSLDEVSLFPNHTGPTSFGGVTYNGTMEDGFGNFWTNQSGLLLHSSSNFTNVSGNPDYGFYYMQYYRKISYTSPDNSKYGNRSLSQYVPTGARYTITESSPSSVTTNVFGGDTFTSKFYVKHRSPEAVAYGGGGGLGFYAQTKVNHQMIDRTNAIPNGPWGYPYIDIILWLENNTTLSETPDYNRGYDINDNAQIFAPFDSSQELINDFPNRIIWSDIKVQNNLSDGYRNYLPLNFKDLDLSFGEIVHHDVVNGELVTWQPRKLQRQYFNTRGQLDDTGLGILIGDGSVLSRDGQTMSAIGTYNKWSVVRGKSAQGNDTFYWINTELKKVIRLSYDGTVSLADVKGMQSFFANSLRWVEGKDTPADGTGICGFWDDRNAEVGWTMNGVKLITLTWDSLIVYPAGYVVKYNGELYITPSGAAGAPAPDTNPEWTLIQHSNMSYYNEYTIIYNEYKDRFTTFASFKPWIYLKWKDTYLSPDYTASTLHGSVYQHNTGSYCSFYNAAIQENGYVEGVINEYPDEVKWAEAMRVQSEVVPYRFEFTNQTQQSFLTTSEFETFERYHESSIKEDSTTSGVNDGDTSLLYGNWLKCKMYFQVGVYQKLYNFIVKFRISSRISNK